MYVCMHMTFCVVYCYLLSGRMLFDKSLQTVDKNHALILYMPAVELNRKGPFAQRAMRRAMQHCD